MAWHMIGHGSDAILYWRWRSAPTNQEQYHGCLLQQDGEPRPVYHEIAHVWPRAQDPESAVRWLRSRHDIALIDRWCERQTIKRQPHHKDYIARDRVIDWYRAWQDKGYGVDVLPVIDRLENYREIYLHRTCTF